jgi:chromosome partitioning protein
MTHCIAFHSYKGGTGKTTIASNLAALLSVKGYKVALLDLDVYAPSLQTYFDKTPEKWINDFLTENADIKDVMVDMTPIIEKYANKVSDKKVGKLWIGFSNPQKEEVYKLEGGGKQTSSGKLQYLRKFIQLREDLLSDYDSDYVIIDTSPGIRYWSINSLAIADTLFLTLKFDDLDIEGTKKIASDIYGSFTKFGAKSYLLLNRVGGYCIPHTLLKPNSDSRQEEMIAFAHQESDFSNLISREIAMESIAAIPCYCDIQFSRKEFLTVLQYPDHPFTKKLERLASVQEIKA